MRILLLLLILCGNMFGQQHWKRAENPFNLNVINKTSQNWKNNVDESIFDWGRASVVYLNSPIIARTKDIKCNFQKNTIEICSNSDILTKWSSKTAILVHKDHILSVIIELNDNISVKNKKDYLICHSLGHSLGLDHQNGVSKFNTASCMDLNFDLYTFNKIQSDYRDFTALAGIYNHQDLDLSNSNISVINKDLGKLKKIIEQGNHREEIYEKDLENDKKIISIVNFIN